MFGKRGWAEIEIASSFSGKVESRVDHDSKFNA